MILKHTVKALNDALGFSCFVLFYLVFGFIPKLFYTKRRLPTQQQRENAKQSEQRKVASTTTEIQSRRALSRALRNADLLNEIGDLVAYFGK